VLATFHDHFDVAPANGLSPPFVIHSPDLADRLDFASCGKPRAGARGWDWGRFQYRDRQAALADFDENPMRLV